MLQLDRVFERIKQTAGKLDVVFANAGGRKSSCCLRI
jgi:NAD(P)-dependent dehydrogenase (short-subunit alcohol dehydrogenase family)